MTKPSLLARARAAAKTAAHALADVGEQAGSLTLTLGPFSAVLYPRQAPLQMPHPGIPGPEAPKKIDLATGTIPRTTPPRSPSR